MLRPAADSLNQQGNPNIAFFRGDVRNKEPAREIGIRIVDESEELLVEKGIKVPLKDRRGDAEKACLYGAEYYALEDGVVGVVMMGEVGGSQARSPRSQ